MSSTDGVKGPSDRGHEGPRSGAGRRAGRTGDLGAGRPGPPPTVRPARGAGTGATLRLGDLRFNFVRSDARKPFQGGIHFFGKISVNDLRSSSVFLQDVLTGQGPSNPPRTLTEGQGPCWSLCVERPPQLLPATPRPPSSPSRQAVRFRHSTRPQPFGSGCQRLLQQTELRKFPLPPPPHCVPDHGPEGHLGSRECPAHTCPGLRIPTGLTLSCRGHLECVPSS